MPTQTIETCGLPSALSVTRCARWPAVRAWRTSDVSREAMPARVRDGRSYTSRLENDPEEAMSVTDELLSNNEDYAAGFRHGSLGMPPARRVAVLACMDAR